MKQNVGLINAYLRITAGFTVLAWATAKLVRRPYRNTPLVVAMLGAMKVAEGITRYCPLTDLFEEQLNTLKDQRQNEQTDSNTERTLESINPS